MGIKSPRLIDMVKQIKGEHDRTVHGSRSAVLYCDSGHNWRTVGEVRGGRAVYGSYGPYDLQDSNEGVYASCKACPEGAGGYVIDLAQLRAKLREPQPGRGPRKIKAADVARRVEPPTAT